MLKYKASQSWKLIINYDWSKLVREDVLTGCCGGDVDAATSLDSLVELGFILIGSSSSKIHNLKKICLFNCSYSFNY